MLRSARRILAAAVFLLVTLLFLDFTGALHSWSGGLAKMQWVPAVLALNGLALAVLLCLVVLFGRIYCSVLCPLGILQDGISHLSSKRKGKGRRFRFVPARPVLRYGVLALFLAAGFAGLRLVVSLLDPYAAYGRIAATLFAPVYRWGNNLLAWVAERVDSFAFARTDVVFGGAWVFGVALLTLGVVGFLAWRNGRTYCNTVCPVGTVLGLLSRSSIFRPAFNPEKCTRCGLCERNCKASCIDVKTLSLDQSRCVTCFNCVEACKFGAMAYTSRRAPPEKPAAETCGAGAMGQGISRRSFLAILGGMAVAHTVKAQQLRMDGGLAALVDKKQPERTTPIVPPGAKSRRNLVRRCTACQLCVSSCPNHILVPSGRLDALMQPEISFERGFCRPECTACSQVCPTGAIAPVTTAEKSGIAIGQAVWIRENCIVNTAGVQCRACQRRCPAGAITLVDRGAEYGDPLQIPVVDKELCIGCGACEYVCPARPFGAIVVEGYARHHSV